MSDWGLCSVGELCAAGIVELQTGPFGTQLHAHDYVPDGIPVVPTEALRGRQIDHSVLPTISLEKADELRRHRLKIGDILFARRGVQATGHIGYVRDREAGFICGTGAIRLRVTEGNPKISPDFLSHVLANPASIRWFKFHAIGATMPNLNEGIIRAFSFSVPPIEEQKRIADFLSAVDDKVELNHRMNQTLEAMTKTLFRDWFVNFGPTRAKVEARRPYLSPELWRLFPEAFGEDGNPTGWAMSEIGKEARCVGGSTPSTADPSLWNGGVHWATPRDMSSLRAPVLLSTDRTISQEGLEKISSGLLPPGTLLLSSRAPIGYLAIAEVPVAINQGFIALVPDGRLSNIFLWQWVTANMDVILQNANGSTFQEISKGNFKPLKVLVPPPAILEKFDENARPIYERIRSNALENLRLVAIRDYLLPKLMSGELRLKDPEKRQEGAL